MTSYATIIHSNIGTETFVDNVNPQIDLSISQFLTMGPKDLSTYVSPLYVHFCRRCPNSAKHTLYLVVFNRLPKLLQLSQMVRLPDKFI